MPPKSGLSLFQSTRPVRGGTGSAHTMYPGTVISIHPPRAGRDFLQPGPGSLPPHFNPPAPCGAGHPHLEHLLEHLLFQSTRPVRGGTLKITSCMLEAAFQSTRPVRGGTLWGLTQKTSSVHFNPPAPCGAGRPIPSRNPIPSRFQSTRPVRGGTWPRLLCVEGGLFQSTRPVRGGTILSAQRGGKEVFQSTRPVRGGTLRAERYSLTRKFQSTRPVRGGTTTWLHETQRL